MHSGCPRLESNGNDNVAITIVTIDLAAIHQSALQSTVTTQYWLPGHNWVRIVSYLDTLDWRWLRAGQWMCVPLSTRHPSTLSPAPRTRVDVSCCVNLNTDLMERCQLMLTNNYADVAGKVNASHVALSFIFVFTHKNITSNRSERGDKSLNIPSIVFLYNLISCLNINFDC